MKQKITFALIMGIITTGTISFTLIGINIGFTESFLATWSRSWVMSYMLVIPVILFVGPRVQSLVNYFFREKRLLVEEDFAGGKTK